MAKSGKIKYTESEIRRLSGTSTKVYFRNVMQKLFRERWEDHLKKLLGGDRETLDLCAAHLTKNLDFFPLLHTLCLVTGQRFDLNEKDRSRAADLWVCWYNEGRDRLEWNAKEEHWQVKG